MGHLKLHNTRTRSLETFAPLRGDEVRIYVCGLTPSAQAHLGHARSFLFFDLLRRYLKHKGFNVTYVQNVTDIDDRSIDRARETGERLIRYCRRGYYGEFKNVDANPRRARAGLGTVCDALYRPISGDDRRADRAGHAYVGEDGMYYRVKSFPAVRELQQS